MTHQTSISICSVPLAWAAALPPGESDYGGSSSTNLLSHTPYLIVIFRYYGAIYSYIIALYRNGILHLLI